MSLFRNVISKLGTQVQQTAETVGQTVGQTVGKRVSQSLTQSLDAALSSRLGHAVGEAWQKTLAGVTPGASETLPAWSAKEFEKQIRNRLKHHVSQHPFYRQLKDGTLNQTQLHVWLANEWYFQQNLPLKDAAILSNCEDAAFRRAWARRLLEQDGTDAGAGAVEHWVRLSESMGLAGDTLTDMALVTPGVRFAVDTYINFARRAPWAEAVCASLGELSTTELLRGLFDTLAAHYGKPDGKAVDYFSERSVAQRKDWDAAIEAVCDYFKSREDQEYALDILQFKHDILWTCLDSISLSPLSAGDSTQTEAGVEPPLKVKGEPPQRSRKKKPANRASGSAKSDSGKSVSSKGNPSKTAPAKKAGKADKTEDAQTAGSPIEPPGTGNSDKQAG